MTILDKLDLTQRLDREQYEKRLMEEQRRLLQLRLHLGGELGDQAIGVARGHDLEVDALRSHQSFALGDDRGHHLEAEAARQRAEHQVWLQATDERAHLARPAGVVHDEPCVWAHRRPAGRARTGNCASSRARHRGRHAALGSLDRGCARVDHGDMEPGRRGEVGRGNASHHAGAEDEDVHRNAPCGIWRVAGARAVRQAPSRVITWCSSRSPRPRSG
jgi:hypothetical protein